jgi:tetratricopeptide (TPR) repeat protein
VQLNPKYYEAFNNRGVAQHNLGNYAEAIADYDKAVKLNPNYAEAFNNRGKAQYALGKYKEAYINCSLAFRLKPDYAEAIARTGCSLIKLEDKNRLTEALFLINKGLELDKTMAWVNDCKTDALNKLKE